MEGDIVIGSGFGHEDLFEGHILPPRGLSCPSSSGALSREVLLLLLPFFPSLQVLKVLGQTYNYELIC